MNLKENITFPFILFLLFTLLTNFLVVQVSEPEILENLQVASPLFEYFKTATVVLSLISMIALPFLSRKFSIEQMAKHLFIFATFMLVVLFFISLPMRETPLLTEHALMEDSAAQSSFIHFYRNWDLILLFGLLSLWPSAMMLFFYGYANENYTFKEATKYYPLFGLIALTFTNYILPSINLNELECTRHTYGCSLVACGLGAIGCLFWINKINRRDTPEKLQENSSGLGIKFVIYLGVLMAFSGIIIRLAQTVWNFDVVATFPTPADYAHYFSKFEVYSEIAYLMTLSVFLSMSVCFSDRLAKAWKNTYYAIACVSFILGGAFFVSVIYKVPLIEMLSKTSSFIPLEALNSVGAGYQILMSSVIYPVVLCLKELALVAIPRRNRWTAKLTVDLIFSKMTIFLTSVSLSSLFLTLGANTAAFPIIALLFFAIAITRFAFIHLSGKELIKATASFNFK